MENIADTIQTIEKMLERNVIQNSLTSLTVHSFRRFEPETTIDFSFPLTVLVGKNGSGKTTIMKMILTLVNCNSPEEIFFETAIDDGGMKNASFSYHFSEAEVNCKHVGVNRWNIQGQVPRELRIIYLNPKTLIGAFEKSFLYDDIGKNPKRSQKVDYVIRQSRKVLQNKLKESGKKKEWLLSPETVKLVNEVLQLHLAEIRVVKHKYFSGTWATNVIFSDGIAYSEYNAGNGEFLVALMLDQISHLPEKALLLLDEPEVSLHPGAQKRLMQCLLSIIKKKKLQVIMTTHSASIVENLPPKAIVCLRRLGDQIIAEGNLSHQYAFTEIEESITKKHIIVEDLMAKHIVEGIIIAESLGEHIQVDFYPGGADNLKIHTIFTYAKTHITNGFVIFDGDQKPSTEIPDFSEVLEKDKTLKYYKDVFRNIVGVSADAIVWGVDANRKTDRKNEDQEKLLLVEYLEFYRNNVRFLPKLIPEDMIFDADKLRAICGDLPSVDSIGDSKSKLKVVADSTGYDFSDLISILTTSFIKNKNEDYQYILALLRSIIER